METAKTIQALNVVYELAQESDVPELAILDRLQWGDVAATEEKILNRIQTFPQGSHIARVKETGQIIAYLVLMRINYDFFSSKTWEEITHGGLIDNHINDGEYVYGVNLSVHPDHEENGIGGKMVDIGREFCKSINCKGIILGSRVPCYAHYLSNGGSGTPIDQYVFHRKDNEGRPYDDLLKFWSHFDFKPVKIVPNFMPDPDSCNFGVLCLWTNQNYLAEKPVVQACAG